MYRCIAAIVLVLGLGLGGCDNDTIELGSPCTGSAQCKEPADTCMEVAGKRRCTLACTKDHRCPSGYVCPVTDPAVRTSGMCLPAAEIGPNVVRVY